MSEENKILNDEDAKQVSGSDGGEPIDDWKIGDFGKLLYEVNSVSVFQITKILPHRYAESIKHTRYITSHSGIHPGAGLQYRYQSTPNYKITLTSLEKLDRKPDWIPDNVL